MAIPASNIVSINPRVLAAGGTDLEINGLLLTKSSLIPVSSMVTEFTSADAVGEYLGTDSPEYIASVKYFAGYSNCFAYPKRIMIGRRVDEPVGAEVSGGKFNGSLEDLKAATDGVLTLRYNGEEYALTDVDLSGATSLSNAAEILTEKASESIEGISVAYTSLNDRFVVTFPIPGEDIDQSTGAVLTTDDEDVTDLAVLLALTEDAGAITSDASDALTVADNFKAIRKQTDNWVCFSTAYPAEDEEILEYMRWASGMGVQYLYVCWTLAPNLLIQGESSSIASQLVEANAGSITLVYGDLDYAAFIMGVAASIDWNRTQGVITFAFRSQDGLAATVVDETEADILLGKKCNIYGNYATRNDNYIWLYNGCMFGDYNFIDSYINAIWLNNALQVSLMEGLKTAGRTPYTDAGYTMIRAWMMDPVNRAVNNGVIDAGVTLSDTQKSEVYREVGWDISEELYARGYVIIITDPGAQVRTNRESPNISLYYCYGGSVHKLTVASTVLI